MLTLNTLPTKAARLCLKIEKFCRKYYPFENNTHIILALSGGSDSTALACIMTCLKNRMNLNLSAIALDHNLRKESKNEIEFVSELCKKLEINCNIYSKNIKKIAKETHQGIEETGRIIRYKLFEEERKKNNAQLIALGHQKSDLTEDIILRFMRGTGWPALGGMNAYDNERKIIRPLLHIKPNELKNFLIECNISWIEDKSNNNKIFLRNYVRHEILPKITLKNPNIEDNGLTLWHLSQYDKDYFNTQLNKVLENNPLNIKKENNITTLSISKNVLQNLHSAIRLRLYIFTLRYIEKSYNIQFQARFKTLLALENAVQAKKGNTTFQFSKNITAKFKNGNVVFSINV